MPAGYGRDLARVHHEGFGDVATDAARLFLRTMRRRSGLVVELGCGSGIFSRAVSRAGYDVLGIDQSAEMLRLARRTVPRGRFVHGSAFDAHIPPCAGVAAIGEVLCYRFDRSAGLTSLTRVFRRAYRALEPGGVFLLDVSSPGRGGPDGSFVRWREGDGWSMTGRTTERGNRLTREMSVFVRERGRYRRVDETHELVLYRPEDVEDRLRSVGFSTRRRAGYDGLKLPGWWVFLARKPRRP